MGSADLGKNNPISHSLVQNLRQQLMRVLPFSKMAIADVDYFLRHSIEAYFAPGETILSPADGVPKDLYLIRQGRVSGRRLIPGFEEMGFELAAVSCFQSVPAMQLGQLLPIMLRSRIVSVWPYRLIKCMSSQNNQSPLGIF